MKTEVYSWRVSPELKMGLEREARRRKISLSAALDMAAKEWLGKNGADKEDEREQRRIHEAASKFVGAISSGEPYSAQKVRETVRKRVRRHYGR